MQLVQLLDLVERRQLLEDARDLVLVLRGDVTHRERVDHGDRAELRGVRGARVGRVREGGGGAGDADGETDGGDNTSS
ncbi:hypothetical protein QFZ22_001617 [Streptomyces canus]|uniref:Uncharacterized protein n=1 Tax=Streptomyces canus TaxID=58343 RepID=A0AAW8FA08_9ACTN|nr:hypothetical protein [Streptomyces canus]